MKPPLPNFTRPLKRVGEHNIEFFRCLFLNLDRVLSDSTPETFRQHLTNKMKLNKIVVVWNSANSRFSDVFGLFSSRNFSTMATWHNDISSLYHKTAGDFWQITTQLKTSARQYWPEFSLIDYYGYNHRFFATKTAIGNVIIAVFDRNKT